MGLLASSAAIGSLSLVVLLHREVEVGEIALRREIRRRQLRARLQFGNGVVVLAFVGQDLPQLNVGRCLLRMRRDQFAQILLGLGQPPSAHVDVRQPRDRVRRRIERHRLLVFAFGFGKLALLFQQKPGRDVRLRILRLQDRSLAISRDRLFWLRRFQHMRQRKPRPRLTLRDVAGGLELRGCAQELGSVRLIRLGELQPQIQVRLEHIRLRRDGLTIRRDGLVHLAQPVLHETEFKPRDIIRVIAWSSTFRSKGSAAA